MHIDLFPLRKAITYQPGHNHPTYFFLTLSYLSVLSLVQNLFKD